MRVAYREYDDRYVKGKLRDNEQELTAHELRLKTIEAGLRGLHQDTYDYKCRQFALACFKGNLDECQKCFWYFGTCNNKNAEIIVCQESINRFELEVVCTGLESMDDGNQGRSL